MFASTGLATTNHAIKAMIAPGLDVVSAAKPTATTHIMPVDSRKKPRPLTIKDPLGVGNPEAKAKVPISRIA
jgi:hypothetical protein